MNQLEQSSLVRIQVWEVVVLADVVSPAVLAGKSQQIVNGHFHFRAPDQIKCTKVRVFYCVIGGSSLNPSDPSFVCSSSSRLARQMVEVRKRLTFDIAGELCRPHHQRAPLFCGATGASERGTGGRLSPQVPSQMQDLASITPSLMSLRRSGSRARLVCVVHQLVSTIRAAT